MDGRDLMVIGGLVIALPFVQVLLAPLGLAGWFLLGAVVFAVGMVSTFRGSPGAETTAADGWNCGDCGARNDGDAESCHHCGTSGGR